MEPRVVASQTNSISLDEAIRRLMLRDEVAAILLVGATGAPCQSASSDHDLLLIVDTVAVPFRIVHSWIDHRLAEVYCTTISVIARISSQVRDLSLDGEASVIASWLRSGRVVFDRAGLLGSAQEIVRKTPPPAQSSAQSRYEIWRSIGYNLAQLKRYASADNDTSAMVVDLRLLYSVAEVMTGYFTARDLPWQGEKSAIRYWTDHDSAFLEAFQAYLSAKDRAQRVTQYDALAHHAMAPIAPLWAANTTMVALGPPFGADEPSGNADVQAALGRWNELLSAEAP